MILIKHTVDWELIRQQKQTQIIKHNTIENRNQFEHDYNAEDKVMLTNHPAWNSETSYKGTFLITQWFTNGAVNLQYDLIKIRHNIHWIKPHKSNKNFEDINPKHMCDVVKI